MPRLPVWSTVVEAHRFVFANARDFALLAFLPVLIQAVLYTFVQGGMGIAAGAKPTVAHRAMAWVLTQAPWLLLVFALVSIALYVLFSVAWHRRLLVSDERPKVGSAFKWGARQTRFLLRLILVSVLMVAVGVVATGIAAPILAVVGGAQGEEAGLPFTVAGMVALLLVIGLVCGRFLPWFPAAAVDYPLGFADSWRLGRGNTWRLMWIFAIPTIEFAIPIELLGWGAGLILATTGLGGSLTASLLYFLLTQGIAYFGLAITVSCISIAFRDLIANRPAPSPESTAT